MNSDSSYMVHNNVRKRKNHRDTIFFFCTSVIKLKKVQHEVTRQLTSRIDIHYLLLFTFFRKGDLVPGGEKFPLLYLRVF